MENKLSFLEMMKVTKLYHYQYHYCFL
jgi:hypothetical protein